MKTTINKNARGHNYSYTDLAEVNKYCEENKIQYYQTTKRIEGDDYIFTHLTIDGKEQAERQGSRVVDAVLMGIKNPAQEQGSAITYARRYSLLMALGLATEDDDAQSLSRMPKSTAQATYSAGASEKQLGLIRTLSKKNGYDIEAVEARIKQIKSSAEASEAISKLMSENE